ncbi:hypothetical protein CC86DRAFT_55017 [Ophiobolus disseminans]|uniref:HAUS augmin-like complex subunit 3 N-terminal domain-containing protein n=1 Tax=Ophiobolus disseminans TaxID=1469910 RepID=A0A6A6ZVL6_9PLEO|nr:hypothetical protein CC86DRAFT_55017 [Ophiobolus disseminans]
MAEEQAAHHLLNVLEERGLDVDLDKILLGFEDGRTKRDAAAWVEEYLHEDTLLSKEELELYHTLRKKGLLHQYESEGEPVRPILDHEIASAIESLQNSTAVIEAQCKVLEAQKDAFVKLKALDKPNLDVEHARNERRRKEGQEKARLDVAVDDVAVAITEQLTDTQKEIDTEKSTLNSYLSERLASDDQILSRLPSIVPKLVTKMESSQDEKSIEQWCKAIISFRTGEIKARVDAVYLNTLSDHAPNGHSNAPDDELKERRGSLQAEMEELDSEIASVAEMVVEHELRKPMNEMKDRKDREVTQARIAWLNYVLSTLDYMGRRLDTVAASTKDVDELHQALSHVGAATSKRLPDTHVARLTPPRRRTTSVPSLAFTPMVKLKPSKTLDLPVALQDSLRHAGVPFNQDSIESLRDSLIHAQLDREQKLHDHYTTTSTSTHDRLAERSSKADSDLRVIQDALYKHRPFRQVDLTSPLLEKQLKSMEKELEEKDRELLEAEGNELSLSDPKVRAFIAKYGK